MRSVPLGVIIREAFDLRPYQFAGRTLPSDYYSVEATLAEGSSRADYRAMFQNLLAERFRLRVHKETRELKRFELKVGPKGHRLTDTGTAPEPEVEDPRPTVTRGNDGYAVIPRGTTNMVGFYGKWRIQAVQMRIADFLDKIEWAVESPVVNRTGLEGAYDFDLRWGSPYGSQMAKEAGIPLDDIPPPDFRTALREQLGLVLEDGRGPVEVLVIEDFARVPLEE